MRINLSIRGGFDLNDRSLLFETVYEPRLTWRWFIWTNCKAGWAVSKSLDWFSDDSIFVFTQCEGDWEISDLNSDHWVKASWKYFGPLLGFRWWWFGVVADLKLKWLIFHLYDYSSKLIWNQSNDWLTWMRFLYSGEFNLISMLTSGSEMRSVIFDSND